nr:polysaccharide biosynthesis/export family protein [Flavobacterium sp. SM15]
MINSVQFLRCLILIVCLGLFSCGNTKKIVYLQNGYSGSDKNTSYELHIQPDDLLQIIVSAENPEVAAPYNLKSPSVEGAMSGQNQVEGYLVDKNGEIEFPQIGKIKLEGLTRIEATEKIKTILSEHISNPSIHLRVLNFKISIIGEVSAPGVFKVDGERITLLEALSKSGDLTIYGKRKNIMVIREKNGEKTIEKVDITNSDFINSPYYYLAQNDVVYVEPNKTRINNSVIGSDIRATISILSFAIGVILIFTH